MSPKKILFVDDEPVVVELMKKRLLSRGFDVETARDGLEAVQKAKTSQPSLIILDVIMPLMDGFEICRKLKKTEETAGIPVILFTASQDDRLEEKAAQAGASGLVQKPFVDEVFKKVTELLGEG